MTEEPRVGRVREWKADEGWGVIDSADTPGGCWCHFSALSMAGYHVLAADDMVEFHSEAADQDGFAFRAIEAWPIGARVELEPPTSGSVGYASRRTISWTGWEPQRENEATYDVIAAAYDARQDDADREGSWLSSLLDQLARLAPAGLVLDLGCGPGRHLAELADRGLVPIGLDLSRGMAAQAQQRSSRLVVGRMEQLPFRSGSVDAVWSSFALLHVPLPQLGETLAEIARVLVPGGPASLTFAGGDAMYREPVSYVTGRFRTFYPATELQVRVLATSAGFDVVEQSADPETHRSAHHALLRRT